MLKCGRPNRPAMRVSHPSAWIAGSKPGRRRKSFSRRVRARVLFDSPPLGITEGRRSADRRIHPLSAPRTQMSPPACAPGAAATPAGAARLSALHRGSRLATECFDSAQTALRASERTRALPAPSIALKPSTWLAGRHAGGDDARTARVRGYEPRPREPHSLRFRDRLEKRPSTSEIRGLVTEIGTNVKSKVTGTATTRPSYAGLTRVSMLNVPGN